MKRALRFGGMAAAVVLSAGVLSGCLISGSSASKMRGEYVGPSTYGEIDVGRTTDEWLLAALGEPTSKSDLADGRELWKWGYTKTSQSRSAVFLIFGGASNHVTTGATYVELCDGVVVKKWRD